MPLDPQVALGRAESLAELLFFKALGLTSFLN